MTIELYNDPFEALFDDPAEAALQKMRAETLMALRRTVGTWRGTQQAKAERLGITQPRFSLLMHAKDDRRFQLDSLIGMAVRAGMGVQLNLAGKPKAAKKAVPRHQRAMAATA